MFSPNPFQTKVGRIQKPDCQRSLEEYFLKGFGVIVTLYFIQKGSGVYGKRAEAHATAEKYVYQDAGCHGFGGLSCGEHDDPPQYINFSETCGSGLVATGILFEYTT